MQREIILNGTWELRDEPLGGEPAETAARLQALRQGWIASPVPGDIHQGLVAAGRIEEPLLGLNSEDCRWTEDRAWWYRKTFDAPSGWKTADRVEIALDGLDANAELFLNGLHIGAHRNAFRPFVADVKPGLRPTGNVLLIRLSAGLETVCEADLDAPDGVRAPTEASKGRRAGRGDERRIMVRKPQYGFGWDWSPRIATTAIGGDVRLRLLKTACIRDVHIVPVRDDRGAGVRLKATVTVDRLHFWKTADGVVTLSVTDPRGRRHATEWRGLLRSGRNHIDLELPLRQPQLWWPNGYGEHPLYRVNAAVRVGRERAAFPAFHTGLRFLELDTGPGTFALRVNGVKIFCKGANWIPPDALYARTKPAQYRKLVREARAANFNMLRVWGGGRYEHDAFYEACDRNGILVWQDFMYACAPYPDHQESFRLEAEREADHQTRRLRHHPCLALWCGNNENVWGFKDWWDERTRRGAWIYHDLLPEVVRRHCREIPYWNGSPYGGVDTPNSETVGNRHHWHDCMMHAEMHKRITPEEYDRCRALFVSEYGYIGAPVRKTIETYLDGAPFDRGGKVWQHHNNTFEKNTVEAGIRKHYRDPEGLTLDDYLLYAGLCQGLMYGYSLESFRARADCHGCLFWMFNDCWGEVGWSIIDYYLRRKPAYDFVRRALAPVRLILRAEGDRIRVVVANDTRDDVTLTLDCGYLPFDGSGATLGRCRVVAAAAARTDVVRLPRGKHDPAAGLWVARPVGASDVRPGIFRAMDFRRLQVEPAKLSVQVIGDDILEVRAQTYAHAVHLMLPGDAVPEDDYVDLLPGETRRIKVHVRRPLNPRRVKVTALP